MESQRNIFDPLTLGRRAKRERLERKWTIEKLAKEACVNKNTVVRFEKGLSTHPKTIYSICRALDASPFELIESKLSENRDYKNIKYENYKDYIVTRRDERKQRFEAEENRGKGMMAGDLKYRLPAGYLNAAVLEIKSQSKPRSHPGEEMVFALTGTVGVRIGDTDIILRKGESLFFWGLERHQYYNVEKDKISVALSVWLDPGFDFKDIHFFD